MGTVLIVAVIMVLTAKFILALGFVAILLYGSYQEMRHNVQVMKNTREGK